MAAAKSTDLEALEEQSRAFLVKAGELAAQMAADDVNAVRPPKRIKIDSSLVQVVAENAEVRQPFALAARWHRR